MIQPYRIPGVTEVHVWNWDIVRFGGAFRIVHFTDGQGAMSSAIIDDSAAEVGLRFHVESGKTYVLHGPRHEAHNLAALSVRDLGLPWTCRDAS